MLTGALFVSPDGGSVNGVTPAIGTIFLGHRRDRVARPPSPDLRGWLPLLVLVPAGISLIVPWALEAAPTDNVYFPA